ncbi:MAG: sulfite exporter TauE/SafE family protein [Gammaproteobacteria bacterium]|nr:sulfite exporter TauE/SafE family protein [Gammaproteobacteria bacterium]
MMIEISFFAALLVGLLGGVHCVGMCGGLVVTLGLGTRRTIPPLPLLLAYNAGRLLSYTLAGGIAGALGSAALSLGGVQEIRATAALLAGGVMLAIGLYLAGWLSLLTRIERLGAHLWQHIAPIAQRLLPVQSPPQALLLGLLWGWLPCGLVYSVLLWSFSSGSALQGAWLLLGFGLGTLPNLLLMGFAATALQKFVQRKRVRQLAGVSVMLLGALSIWQALNL